MKTYICDACGAVIADPHHERMKEFCVGIAHPSGTYVLTKRKTKIHLCDRCFHGLNTLSKPRIKEFPGKEK